jgi:hypothetical protein
VLLAHKKDRIAIPVITVVEVFWLTMTALWPTRLYVVGGLVMLMGNSALVLHGIFRQLRKHPPPFQGKAFEPVMPDRTK